MQIEQLISSINNNEYCCAIIKNNEVHTSNHKGIKPLMQWLKQDFNFFENGDVADKIVGKAAALLLVLGKAKSVYGKVMSEGAVSVLEENNISYSYGELVKHIINRTNTGICPMEQTVLSITSPTEAYEALQKKIAELMSAK